MEDVPLSNLNLDKEWQEIQNMLNLGIIPSALRLKEYLQACCQGNNIEEEINKVLSCIADILRIEEDSVLITDAALKEILILLETKRPDQQLEFALKNINVKAKEPYFCLK